MTNPKYRVEHVATVPQGWKVRTKMSATHMLRIAFPPGSRKPGSGKVIEIFHPVNENPCAMHQRNPRGAGIDVHFDETIRKYQARTFDPKFGNLFSTGSTEKDAVKALRKQIRDFRTGQRHHNPGAMDRAEELYKTFHGKTPQEILELQESDAARQTYTALGDLEKLVIDSAAGKVEIGFSRADAVKVASAPNGDQLYFLGGNQNLDAQLDQFGTDAGKDFVELGAAVQVDYIARKSIDDFKLVTYWHKLGEETNEPPYAFYDRLKRRIFLAGGRYRVEAPGIIN